MKEIKDQLNRLEKRVNDHDNVISNLKLQERLELLENSKSEREISDKRYAIKLVEVAILGFLGAIGTATIVYLVNFYLKK